MADNKKRRSTIQITKDIAQVDNDDDISEQPSGPFERASEEVLKSRRRVRVGSRHSLPPQRTSPLASPTKKKKTASMNNPFSAIKLLENSGVSDIEKKHNKMLEDAFGAFSDAVALEEDDDTDLSQLCYEAKAYMASICLGYWVEMEGAAKTASPTPAANAASPAPTAKGLSSLGGAPLSRGFSFAAPAPAKTSSAATTTTGFSFAAPAPATVAAPKNTNPFGSFATATPGPSSKGSFSFGAKPGGFSFGASSTSTPPKPSFSLGATKEPASTGDGDGDAMPKEAPSEIGRKKDPDWDIKLEVVARYYRQQEDKSWKSLAKGAMRLESHKTLSKNNRMVIRDATGKVQLNIKIPKNMPMQAQPPKMGRAFIQCLTTKEASKGPEPLLFQVSVADQDKVMEVLNKFIV